MINTDVAMHDTLFVVQLIHSEDVVDDCFCHVLIVYIDGIRHAPDRRNYKPVFIFGHIHKTWDE